jgi:hypothetical protein
MSDFSAFTGMWTYDTQASEKTQIAFIKKGGALQIRVKNNQGFDFEANDLEITYSEDDKVKNYFFGNSWTNEKGDKLFRFETQFRSSLGKGIFVNAMEFTLTSEKSMEQKLMGYKFDEVNERWAHFSHTHSLKKKE